MSTRVIVIPDPTPVRDADALAKCHRLRDVITASLARDFGAKFALVFRGAVSAAQIRNACVFLQTTFPRPNPYERALEELHAAALAAL